MAKGSGTTKTTGSGSAAAAHTSKPASVGDFTPKREYTLDDFEKIHGGGQRFEGSGIRVDIFKGSLSGFDVVIENSNGKRLYIGTGDGNAYHYTGKDITPEFVGNIIRKNTVHENIVLESSGAARKFALMFINKKYK